MIKLTNSQISAFLSPIISELFNDKTRRFPTEDAFLLADMISQIQVKAKIYQDQAKKIIEAHGGDIKPTGEVEYKDLNSQEKAANEIMILNAMSIEFHAKLLTQKPTWPELSIHEAFILRPLMRFEDAEKDGKSS